MTSYHKYRPDIDGLRALAVLAVIIYHAFPHRFPGGFIGVDVFFVISGYLITGILIKDLSIGRFSIYEFYVRRIRRIFPALIAVLVSVMSLGWFVLLADEFHYLAKHVASGAGFVANIALWGEAGYFDAAAEQKPLLHLWSLGIEEQFYLIWPIVLWVGFKYKRVAFWAIPTLILVSLGFCISEVKIDKIAAFYSPLARFWELGLGGMLAYYYYDRPVTSSRYGTIVAEVCALGAVALLVTGFALITKDRSFPGGWALLPVVAAMLLIGPARSSRFSKKVLSSRGAVAIGLISFPLYLWHWPLLSLAAIYSGSTPSALIRAALLLLAIVLAWLTYMVVERPIRFNKGRATTALLSLAMLGVGAFGFVNYRYKLVELTYSQVLPGDGGHMRFFDYLSDNYFECADDEIRNASLKYEGYTRCKQSKPGRNVDIALVGDSHAEHLFIGMAQALPNLNIAFYIQDGLPFIGNEEFRVIYDHVKGSQSIKKVIIAAHWISRLEKVPVGSSLYDELYATAETLESQGKDVSIIGDIPRFTFDPRTCVMGRANNDGGCAIPEAEASEQFSAYIDQIAKVSSVDPRVKYIPISQYLCDGEKCDMASSGRLRYRDRNHLNVEGSKLVGGSLVRDNPELSDGLVRR
jgi:peptidoglycan/LPS O-acetylase OafA/YrhL